MNYQKIFFSLLFLLSGLKAIAQIDVKYDREKALNRHCSFLIKEGKWGAYNLKDKKLFVPMVYDSLLRHSMGFRALKNGQWVILDIIDEVVGKKESDKYDDIASSFLRVNNTRLCGVKRNGKIGFINKKFEVVVPLIYDNAQVLAFECVIGAREGKTLLIDEYTGKELTPLKYDFIRYHNDSELVVGDIKMHLLGIIDFKGNEVLPMEYENVRLTIARNVFGAKKNGKYALFNKGKRERITTFIYDDLDFVKADGLIKARINRTYGLINEKGETIIPFEYDTIKTNEDNEIIAVRSGQNYVFDVSGKLLRSN